LCLQRSYTALAADMNAKDQAYAAANREVQNLSAQLERERASANVNNPDAVARVKALLQRRDAAANSLQPAYAAAADAVSRYNAQVNEYNAHCANRPFNSALVAEIQAHLACPPPR
jgi:chromosome segregation ATPase